MESRSPKKVKLDQPESPAIDTDNTDDASTQICNDVWAKEIAKYLPLAEQYRLARTKNKRLYSLFRAPASRYVHECLTLAITGRKQATLTMIENDPALLLEYGTVTDFSGVTHRKLTVFQLMLKVGDISMIQELLHHVNNQSAMVTQLLNQFPNGIHWAAPFNIRELIQVILHASTADVQAALSHQANDSALCHALNEFRVAFTHHAEQATIFNPRDLIDACNAFDNLPGNLFDSPKKDLIWRQVIGFMQRYLPAHYADLFARSFMNSFINDDDDFGAPNLLLNPSEEYNFTLVLGNDSIFPLDQKLDSRLGYDWAVGDSSNRITTTWRHPEKCKGIGLELTTYARLIRDQLNDMYNDIVAHTTSPGVRP